MRRSVVIPICLLLGIVLGIGTYAAGIYTNVISNSIFASRPLAQKIMKVNVQQIAGHPGNTEETPSPETPVDQKLLDQAVGKLKKELGSNVSATVLDIAAEKKIVDEAGSQGRSPASSSKVVAAATALKVLGAGHRFKTVALLKGDTLYLQGHGDLLLAAGVGNPGAIIGRAGLGDLAKQVAKALAGKEKTVKLRLDDTLLGDSTLLKNWVASGNTQYEAPPTSLAINRGRVKPEEEYQFVKDPAWGAFEAFRAQLAQAGISSSDLKRQAAPQDGKQVGIVYGAPLHQIIHLTLKDSDNTLADSLCRASSKKEGETPSFDAEVKVAQKTLKELGLNGEQFHNQDCSGLSTENRTTTDLLANLISQAIKTPQLKPMLYSLPLATMDGTLHERFQDSNGQGNVRAKTGSLQNSRSLTGYLTTKKGKVLVFSVIVTLDKAVADKPVVPLIDQFVSALAEV